MRAGARQPAPEHRHPSDARSTLSSTITFGRLLARTAGYEIRLARGAAGTVLAAKCVRPGAARSWAGALRREHAVLRRLDAANVVAASGLLEKRAGPILLLEHLGGGDLVSLRGFAPRHWLRSAREVAAGLAHVHARGFAHRDVKARNVRFAADGRACLIDFGSAAPLGAPARTAGTTAAHRRPGAARTVEAADDVHAFAVLLYELMTGRLPRGIGPAGGPAAPDPIAAEGPVRELAALVMRTLTRPRACDNVAIDTFEGMIEAVEYEIGSLDRPRAVPE